MTNKHNIDGIDIERWRTIRERARDTLRRTDPKRKRTYAILQQARDTLRRTDLAERKRRRAIIAEARATLRRGQPIPPQDQKNHVQSERRRVIEKAREAVGQPRTPRPPSTAVNTQFIDQRIDAAFVSRAWEDEARMEAIGLALGQVRAELRKEIADLRAEIDRRPNGGLSDDGKIVVMPKFLKSAAVPPDPPLGPLALDLMTRVTVAEMKIEAAALSELAKPTLIPPLPSKAILPGMSTSPSVAPNRAGAGLHRLLALIAA